MHHPHDAPTAKAIDRNRHSHLPHPQLQSSPHPPAHNILHLGSIIVLGMGYLGLLLAQEVAQRDPSHTGFPDKHVPTMFATDSLNPFIVRLIRLFTPEIGDAELFLDEALPLHSGTIVPVVRGTPEAGEAVLPAHEGRDGGFHARFPVVGAPADIQDDLGVGLYLNKVFDEQMTWEVCRGGTAVEELVEECPAFLSILFSSGVVDETHFGRGLTGSVSYASSDPQRACLDSQNLP